jgi:hypothetical protein
MSTAPRATTRRASWRLIRAPAGASFPGGQGVYRSRRVRSADPAVGEGERTPAPKRRVGRAVMMGSWVGTSKARRKGVIEAFRRLEGLYGRDVSSAATTWWT